MKFDALAAITLDDDGWVEAPDEPRAPFLPEATGQWADFPPLTSLFDYDGSGVMPGRTWVIAPDVQSLERRWQRLIDESDPFEKERLFHPHEGGDKSVTKRTSKGLSGHDFRAVPVAADTSSVIPPERCSVRSFDRQWIVPDNRLINRPNPTLWHWNSQGQVYLTAPDDRSPENGPALSFTGLIPDLHHYNGRGGRVFPLWADAEATRSNVSASLLAHLSESYGHDVAPADVMAYLAAVMAHPAFTARFAADLKQPGLRVPVTADAALFARAVEIGREVIWLHSYGERFDDDAAGRPRRAPRLERSLAPVIPVGGAIPGAPEPLPETMSYDPATRRLTIGKGHVDNVMPEVWAYEVSGKAVVKQWFSYRRRDRTRPVIGDRRPPSPLDRIQPDHWLAEYTADLMNLLHVLGRLVLLEPRQAALLDEILGEPLLHLADLGLAPETPLDSEEDGSDGPA